MKRKIMILLLVALGSFSAMAYEPADNAGLTKKEQRRTLRGTTVLLIWGMPMIWMALRKIGLAVTG